MIKIQTVTNKKMKKLFINFPNYIYKNHPHYVPQLKMDDYELMNRKKHPFHQHSQVEHFVAMREGRVVGRIAAIKNNPHNTHYNERVGFFGLFECINDQDVANILLNTAKKWIKDHGLDVMRGPMNYSYTESQALLIDNFDEHAAALMTYNPPYYKKLIENYGFDIITLLDTGAVNETTATCK